MTKSKMKTICLWRGKSHTGKAPAKCNANSLLMSAVCKKIEPYKVMAVLERLGVAGLEVLAIELGVAPASRKQAKKRNTSACSR